MKAIIPDVNGDIQWIPVDKIDAYSNECYFIVESIKVLKFRMIVSFLYIFSVRIVNLLIWREHNYGGLVI